MDIDDRAQGATWRWPLLISVVILNICLPTLVLSYGVLWVYYSAYDVPLWLGLAAPSFFVLTHGLTQCWFREAADSWGGSKGYRAMASVGLLIVVISLMACAFVPLYMQPFVYGGVAGFGSSLVLAQIDAVIFETYDTRLGIVKGFCFLGQAIGLSIFPHILSALIDLYEYPSTFIVLAGIMLQTLPAILFLRVVTKKSVYFTRYKELSQKFELFRNEGIDNLCVTELQLHSLSKKCWKSPSDDNLHREDDFNNDDDSIVETITPPPSPEEKRRNIFGVEILPEIPEESEESDQEPNEIDMKRFSNKKRLSVEIKRLSTLGDNFDECIINQVRRDSQNERETNDAKDNSEIEVAYETIAPITDIQTEKLFNSFSFRCQSTYTSIRRKLCIPSYRVYKIRRRLWYFVYYLNDTFLKPLKRSLSCGKFYPALMLSFAKLSIMSILTSLLPMIALQIRPKISMFETNFLMSLYGFTWICFLVCTPWLTQTSKRNYKYIAVGGLIVSTCACFVLAEAQNHDTFSIGCVIAGFGYGAVTSCWEPAVQNYVGARIWPKLHSTLETFSAMFLAFLTVGLAFVLRKEGGLQFSMFILGIILSVITCVWIIIASISFYVSNIKRKSWNVKTDWKF